MNVSSTTALTCELKPFEAQFLSPFLPTSSAGTAIFCLIMDKLFNICNESQQHNSIDTGIEAV